MPRQGGHDWRHRPSCKWRVSLYCTSSDCIVFEGADKGLLEVKCPPSKQKMTPAEACKFRDFCCEVADGGFWLKETHPYYFQGRDKWQLLECGGVILLCGQTMVIYETLSLRWTDPLWWGVLEQNILPGHKYFYRFAIVPERLTHHVRRLNFLYTTRGYIPYLKYRDGFHLCDTKPGSLKVCIRKLKCVDRDTRWRCHCRGWIQGRCPDVPTLALKFYLCGI